MKLTKLSSYSKFASKKLQKLQTAVFHCIFTIPFTMNSQNFTFAQISINQRGIKISFYNFMIYQKLKNSNWSTTNKVATNWRTVLRMGKTLLRNIIIRFLSMYVYNLWWHIFLYLRVRFLTFATTFTSHIHCFQLLVVVSVVYATL